MRPDMQHVLIDRPRHGSELRHHGFRNMRKFRSRDPDEAPTHESMKRRYQQGWRTKEQSDHIRPLARWLRTNCGRPWDEVHSDICANIKLDSTMQRHVRGHVDDFVETNTFVGPDGHVWACSSYGYHSDYGAVYPVDRDTFGSARFYVDPRTRRLCEVPRRGKPQRPPAEETQRVLSATEELHKLDGIWYLVTFKPFPKNEAHSVVVGIGLVPTIPASLRRRDVLAGVVLSELWETKHLPSSQWKYDSEQRRWTNRIVRVRPARFAATKKQLSRKELKKYKLK